MGQLSQMVAREKAIGDVGNDFGGALSLLQGGHSISQRSTRELLGSTTSSPWPHLATTLKAIRESETQWHLLRPGPRTMEMSQLPDGSFGPVRWKAGGEAEHRRHQRTLDEPVLTHKALGYRKALVADLKATGFLVEQQDHPFLDMLRQGTMTFDNPLLQMPGFEVSFLFSVTRTSVGEWYVILDRMGTDVPRRWLPVPPHHITPPLLGGDSNYHVTMGGTSISLPPRDVAYYRRANPVDPYRRGRGSMHAADHDVLTDDLASQHIGATFQNSGVPAFLVVMAGLEPKERKRLEEEWRQELTGPTKAGMTKFLGAPRGKKIAEAFMMQEMQNSPQQLQVAELRRHNMDAVLMTNQVPPLAAGVHVSGNRALALVAEKLFDQNFTFPAATAVQNFYEWRFFRPFGGGPAEYGDGWILNWSRAEKTDEGSRDRLMANVQHHFSRADFKAVGGQPVLPGDEFLYAIDANKVLYDSRTGEIVFAPPQPDPGPFGAAATFDGTKFEQLERRFEDLIESLEVRVA